MIKGHNLKLEILYLKYINTKSDIIKIFLKKHQGYFCVVENAYFADGALKPLKNFLKLKRYCNLANKYYSKPVFFSGDINHLNQ